MKKMSKLVFIASLFLLVSVFTCYGAENPNTLIRAGLELNVDKTFKWVNTGIDADLFYDGDLLSLGDISLKPYIGIMLLPAAIAFNETDTSYSGLISYLGGLYLGINGEYDLKLENNKINKAFISIEKWFSSLEVYSWVFKIGYRTNNIYTGAKFNINPVKSGAGLFINYSGLAAKPKSAESTKKVVTLMVDMFNSAYNYYLTKDITSFEKIVPGSFVHIFNAVDEIPDLSADEVASLVDMVNKNIKLPDSEVSDIIKNGIDISKNFYLNYKNSGKRLTRDQEIKLKEDIINSVNQLWWRIYKLIESQQSKK